MKKTFAQFLILFCLLFTLTPNVDVPVVTAEETVEDVQPASNFPTNDKKSI